MNSQQILDSIQAWACTRDFDAPYGVLTGNHTSKTGRKFLSITFGRARTLDATVEIYNRNFMILRTSRHGSQVFNNLTQLQQTLDTL